MSAAGTAPIARRLAIFATDVAAAAATGNEERLRAALLSPYSGVDRLTARAAMMAAGEHAPVLERPELAAFAAAFTRTSAVARAQGATAAELLTTVRAAFALDAGGPDERATLEALDRAAEGCDADAASGAFAALACADAPARPQPQTHPLARRRPQRPSPVKRRKPTFSASALNAYGQCPRKWYYRYVCNAVRDEGSSASFYGSAFHAALESFHREFTRADAAPQDVLLARLDGWIQTEFERYRARFSTIVEYQLLRRRARRTARRYIAWFVERSRAHPFTVIGIEEKVEVNLGGYDFVGYIDRLDRDDASGGVTVVDYKTGSIAQSAHDYRRSVTDFADFQLPFYYWARTAAGDRVTRLALVPLKEAHGDVVPIELEVVPVPAGATRWSAGAVGTIGIAELERARAKMVEIARTLADEPIESFAVTNDAEDCTFCAYLSSCRQRPARAEERFGR